MSGTWHVFLTWRLSLALLCLGQGACMGTWPVRQSTVAAAEAESSLAAALAFAERVAVFSNAENARERALLNLSGTHPGGQMRLALLYGMPLEAGDLVKGQGVLLSVLANDIGAKLPKDLRNSMIMKLQSRAYKLGLEDTLAHLQASSGIIEPKTKKPASRAHGLVRSLR